MTARERRALLDWVIRPALRTVPGVASTATWRASTGSPHQVASEASSSAMSADVTDPNSVPSSPAFAFASTDTPRYFAAIASAAFFDLSFAMSFCLASSTNSRAAPLPVGIASLRGTRKLRA